MDPLDKGEWVEFRAQSSSITPKNRCSHHTPPSQVTNRKKRLFLSFTKLKADFWQTRIVVNVGNVSNATVMTLASESKKNGLLGNAWPDQSWDFDSLKPGHLNLIWEWIAKAITTLMETSGNYTMRNLLRSTFAVLIAACCATAVSAQISITDGTSTYAWNGATGASSLTGAGIGNQMFEDIWVVRSNDAQDLGGATQVQHLLSGGADSSSFTNSGNTGQATFGFNSIWDGTPLFNISIDFAVNTNVDGNPRVSYDFNIDYVNSGAFNDGAGALSVFHYFDVCLDGCGSDDISVETSGSTTSMHMSTAGRHGFATTTDASFEIQAWSGAPGGNIKDRIDETYNLDGSTTSLTGVDITAAYQWDFTVSTVGESFNSFSSLSIPEPTSGVLLLIGFAGLALRRRKK